MLRKRETSTFSEDARVLRSWLEKSDITQKQYNEAILSLAIDNASSPLAGVVCGFARQVTLFNKEWREIPFEVKKAEIDCMLKRGEITKEKYDWAIAKLREQEETK